jgi:hypothetical protein
LVKSPTKTPPANLLGAPANGMPAGSMIESSPSPLLPPGALENHKRPNALLIEMPSGLLTDGCDADAALGDVTELRNAGLCAVKSCTRPSNALAWPPAAAKLAGTTSVAPSRWSAVRRSCRFGRPHRSCLASRVTPVQTALRNCSGDEGGPFGFGDQVADPKPPRAAAVKRCYAEDLWAARTRIVCDWASFPR